MTAGPVTVLVVDDQAPFRLAMRAVIDRMPGFVVAGEAETGEESLTRFDELQPMLVLMDMNLPGIGGIEATRRILAASPDAVVFLCSTYGRADLPTEVETSGAATYVHKEELTAALLARLWDEHGR